MRVFSWCIGYNYTQCEGVELEGSECEGGSRCRGECMDRVGVWLCGVGVREGAWGGGGGGENRSGSVGKDR